VIAVFWFLDRDGLFEMCEYEVMVVRTPNFKQSISSRDGLKKKVNKVNSCLPIDKQTKLQGVFSTR